MTGINKTSLFDKLTDKQLSDYLSRLQTIYGCKTRKGLLFGIHKNHILNIPFENIDIILNKNVSLDIKNKTFEKIIKNKRGGCCFELNGLFACLLQKLEYQFKICFARVLWKKKASDYPVRDHKVLLVNFSDSIYLCDVGFGSNALIYPIPIKYDMTHTQYNRELRIVTFPPYQYVLQIRRYTEWENCYAFDDSPCHPNDFIHSNYYFNFSPDSTFKKEFFCILPTKNGCLSIIDKLFTKIQNNGKEVFFIKEYTTMENYLEKYFKIKNIDAISLYNRLNF